jgi:hypothetical protein
MVSTTMDRQNGETAYREWLQRKNDAEAIKRAELRQQMTTLQSRLKEAASSHDEQQQMIASMVTSWRTLHRQWSTADEAQHEADLRAAYDAEVERARVRDKPLARPPMNMTPQQQMEWKEQQDKQYWLWRKQKDDLVVQQRAAAKAIKKKEVDEKKKKEAKGKEEYHNWMHPNLETLKMKPGYQKKIEKRKSIKAAKEVCYIDSFDLTLFSLMVTYVYG